MQKLNRTKAEQKGAALIIFAIILVLAAMAYLIKMFDPVTLQASRVDKNTELLTQAKQALISHSVSRATGVERPGDMPLPDRLLSPIETPPAGGPPNYDGTTDSCTNTGTAAMNCFGRLPWRTIGLAIPNPSQNDTAGSMPWYAVSANLVDPTCLAVLNSNTLNLTNNPPPAALDCSGLSLPYPWLTVIDSAGHVLSEEVAAVIMLPGAILPTQARPAATLAGVTNYLDSVTIPVGCVGTCVAAGVYSNADFDNIFVVPPPFTAGSTSNDRLIYITKDELVRELERRATQEAATQLKRYYTNSSATAANRFYPYAANLAVPSTNNACVEGNKAGLLPFFAGCISNGDCVSSFVKTPTVQFTRVCTGNYTASTGACTFLGTTCTCTGAGSCTRNPASTNNSCFSTANLRRFTCDALGHCVSNVIGQFTYTYTSPVPDNTVVSGACTITAANTITCTAPGNFSITNCSHANKALATLPAWFTENNWQEHIYYAISNNCSAASTGCGAADLSVGTKNNVHAVVIGLGRTLAATEAKPAGQAPPSSDPKDYLDSIVNTDGGTATDPANTIFDATSKMPTNDYNDQSLIVAP